jgi:hypothetical protein
MKETLKAMNNEFNLEQALVGKAVVHEQNPTLKSKGVIESGKWLIVNFNDETPPMVVNKNLAQKVLRMAEEEMYIVASRLELEKMMLGKTAIWDSNPYKRGENLSHARVFKLVEVTE